MNNLSNSKNNIFFHKIAIAAQHQEGKIVDCARQLCDYFKTSGNYEVFIENKLCDALDDIYHRSSKEIPMDINQFHKNCDLVISLGGDGNMMRVARFMIDNPDIPIVGVNFGLIGFLTDLEAKNIIECMDNILSGAYTLSYRPILQGKLYDSEVKDDNLIGYENAVNEIAIRGRANILNIEINIMYKDSNGKTKSFTYVDRSDGIIIATGTGSTGHALAAGGSILHPDLPAILIVPICSYILSSRPMIIPYDCSISLSLKTRYHNELSDNSSVSWSYDGKEHPVLIKDKNKLTIETVKKGVCFLHHNDYNFFQNCKAKIGWSR